MNKILLILALAISVSGCKTADRPSEHKGKLFIIGGGNKTDPMLNELIDLADVRNDGYIYVLPMASSVPDSAILWVKEDFADIRFNRIAGYVFSKGVTPPKGQLDSLRNAKLIFISGGDQARFMDVVLNTSIMDAIHEAYNNGAVVSGTSAGAAVMSKKMITGNQLKHPDAESGFTSIESDNVEITQGLGMLEGVIIDQHFIKRQRLNRLVAASIENPDKVCIGIDESTAIVTQGDSVRVTGIGQVVVIRNHSKIKDVKDGLLGTTGLQLDVYITGQKFKL